MVTHYDPLSGPYSGNKHKSIVWAGDNSYVVDLSIDQKHKLPMHTGDPKNGLMGFIVEHFIAICIHRLEQHQRGRFACAENDKAIQHLKAAFDYLKARTRKRELAGVEGTQEIG